MVGLPRWTVPVAAHALSIGFVTSFIYLASRSLADAPIIFLPEVIRDVYAQFVLVELGTFEERLHSLLYVAFDAALICAKIAPLSLAPSAPLSTSAAVAPPTPSLFAHAITSSLSHATPSPPPT